MMPRTRMAAVQLAVFVGGGLLGPVVHLAGHRPDHTHGAGGQVIALRPAAPPAAPTAHAHASPHAHPHRLPQSAAGRDPAHAPAVIDSAGSSLAHARPPARTGAWAEPLESRHGHGSIAHLGLALLSAAPPLALPAPEPAGVLPRTSHPRGTALFEPSFPLPRPPPATELS